MVFGENHNLYLAYSLVKGHLNLIETPQTLTDLSYFEGKYYWALGPLPAVLLTPFALIFKSNFQENFIKFPITIVNFWLVYAISKKLDLKDFKPTLVAIFFIFGSVYTPVATIPFSVFLSQLLGTTFILLSILEFTTKRRWAIIGISIACATLSRTTLILATIFFLTYLIMELKRPMKNIFLLIIPVLATLVTMVLYNYQRFGSFNEFGFSYRITPEETMRLQEKGLFSLANVPTNLYHMLVRSPEPVLADNFHRLKPPFIKPDYWGMSIFLISPILFLLFKTSLNEKLVKLSFLTTLVMLIPITTYYGIGWRQIGYRYALDFMPFLLIPLSYAIKSTSQKRVFTLVGLGVIITWFFTLEMLLGF